ncbi:MAG: peptide chain release factor 3, partial [Clostridia bacterium]|nr:peptide chain release factor 3 [Clostridia bacterium]
ESFLQMTTQPLSHKAGDVEIEATDERFSAFVFKIQANMNKAHRDRIAFMRICSGKFERNKEYFHVQGGKNIKLAQPQQMMAQEREGVEVAYAGDIIGVFDPGIFSIGDTICAPGMKVAYEGIPNFTPEHFAYVEQIDSMKRKQFAKGMNQIAQEGAIRIFFEPNSGMERVIVGVVGVLQYDVLKFRMQTEYGVGYIQREIPYDIIRYVGSKSGKEIDPSKLKLSAETKWIQDVRGNDLLLFPGNWAVTWALEHNEDLELLPYGSNA